MTITEFQTVAILECIDCGAEVEFDYAPIYPEYGCVCAGCETTYMQAFYEQCWAFINRIEPPALEE